MPVSIQSICTFVISRQGYYAFSNDRFHQSALSSLQAWFWPCHPPQRVTGVLSVGLPWSDKSTFALVPGMMKLYSVHERMSTCIWGELDLPPAANVLVEDNFPFPWVAGVEGNDSFAIVKRIRDIDIEELPVVQVLDSPTIVVVYKSPLK